MRGKGGGGARPPERAQLAPRRPGPSSAFPRCRSAFISNSPSGQSSFPSLPSVVRPGLPSVQICLHRWLHALRRPPPPISVHPRPSAVTLHTAFVRFCRLPKPSVPELMSSRFPGCPRLVQIASRVPHSPSGLNDSVVQLRRSASISGSLRWIIGHRGIWLRPAPRNRSCGGSADRRTR